MILFSLFSLEITSSVNSSSLYKLFHIQCFFVCRWWPKRNDSEFSAKCFNLDVEGLLSALWQLWANENPLKMMKNVFCFILNSFFVLFSLHPVLSWLFGYAEKQLDNKVKIHFKIYDAQTGQQIIAIHILPNISVNLDNQWMKFGQLVEYNVGNIFLQKSCRKCGMETSSRPLGLLGLIFKKVLYKVKISGQYLNLKIFR